MIPQIKFSLNRIMQPNLSLQDFIHFASECSAEGVEIRNDLSDPSLLGGESPESVLSLCREKGVSIVTVNALQRFNDPALFGDKKRELKEMMAVSSSVGCRRIVLCPVNDPGDARDDRQKHEDLVSALVEYADLFREYRMIGLVEPLGFAICSVRYKRQAVDAINESGHTGIYQIVHDTFHHYLSGETEMLPLQTGLIHASGVVSGKRMEDITDEDRLMVDEKDIMDNRGQIAALYHDGFNGIFSFEPFSPEVQNLPAEDAKEKVGQSITYLFGV